MTKEQLTALGLTDEQAEKAFELYGKGIKKFEKERDDFKAKVEEREKEIANLKLSESETMKEFEALKQSNAGAEDWKAKYEQLTEDNRLAAERTETERKAAERKADQMNLFNAASLDNDGKERKWTNDFTKIGYFSKFVEAVEKNDGTKTHKDIFHELTKDDATAFIGVERLNLHGANNNQGDPPPTDEFQKRMEKYKQKE